MSWAVVSQYNGEDDTDTQMEDAGRQTKITLKPEAQICPSSRDAARQKKLEGLGWLLEA